MNVKEYDVLSKSCNKVMFFCSVRCPKMPLALKLEDKNSSLTLECKNIRKAISDLSAKIENLCSSEKELQKNIKETSTILSSIQPYNVSDSSCCMAVDIIRKLKDKECHKNSLIFYNVPEPTTPSWKADSAYIIYSDLCRITFDLNLEIIKSFCLGKKIDKSTGLF